jgi:hypothetical protein
MRVMVDNAIPAFSFFHFLYPLQCFSKYILMPNYIYKVHFYRSFEDHIPFHPSLLLFLSVVHPCFTCLSHKPAQSAAVRYMFNLQNCDQVPRGDLADVNPMFLLSVLVLYCSGIKIIAAANRPVPIVRDLSRAGFGINRFVQSPYVLLSCLL